MLKQTQKIVVFIICLIFPSVSSAIDRRKDQFPTEPSYLVVPLPYSLPGIGSGIILTGLAGNILDTHIDAFVLGIFGDAEGYIGSIQDIHLLPETLIIGYQKQYISKAVVNNYEKRGMDTEMDDFNLIELSKVDSDFAEVRLSLFDRRLELFGQYNTQAIAIPRVRDSEGEIITEFDPPYEQESQSTSYGALLDYTDDYQDPRMGIRWRVSRNDSPPQNEVDADYFVIDQSLSLYIPIGDLSTWAFNYYTSDAIVNSEGQTDETVIKQNLGLNCPSTNQECLDVEQQITDLFIAQRKYGTSNSLGGQNRLRSYPQGRYSGAHTLYYGTEFRWTFSEGSTPFDFLFWKDVASGFQVAFFYETGSVADETKDLGDIVRTSSGTGFRMVTASGFVYRADLATGEEGANTTIIFEYPW